MKAHVVGAPGRGSRGSQADAQQEVAPDKTILHNGRIQAQLPVPHVLSHPLCMSGQGSVTLLRYFISQNMTI